MKHTAARLGTILMATVAVGLPAAAPAQQQTTFTGTQAQAAFQSALRDEPASIRRLASMNQVDETVVRLIPVEGPTGARRRTMGMRDSGTRAELMAALDKATVEELNRPNGVDQRQNSFADYLMQHDIDPKSVLAVSITANPDDKQNPFVNVFYRKSGMRATR